MKEKLKRLFGLFGAFAIVGVTTFGGGYAMLPALQREVVEKRRWATEEEVMDWYAIGQCTPGVIAVNTATFVGQKQAGVWGGIFATLGVVFPSLIIIMIIAAFIQNFAHLPAVQNAFAGIRVCVCVLILNAVVKLWKKSVVDWKTFLIFLLVFAGSVFLNISPVLYVLAAAVAGVVIRELEARLFWEFFKTGLFSVGGGLATLPFIYDMSDRTGWFTYQQIADMVAVSESTPGPIGVNTATYVGYVTAGVPGSLIATLGLVTPAVICILIIASCLKKFRENRFVDHAFYGLRPASAGLIAAAGFAVVRISLLQESTFRESGRFTDLFFWKGLLLAAVIWVLTNVVKPTKKLHPIVYIAASAVAGIVFSFAGA